jgi:predicted RNA-binding protein with TRAM domain
MRAPHVQPGAEFDVVVRERARRDPERNGVARIDGLVVVIPDCKPGDRLRIRIIERRPTLAKAEIIERVSPDAM